MVQIHLRNMAGDVINMSLAPLPHEADCPKQKDRGFLDSFWHAT